MKRFLALALCALVAGQAGARTLYVDAGRPNNKGSGLSAAKAKKTLQAAVNIAKAGDTIVVLPGTYAAPLKTNNRKIRIKSKSGAESTSIRAKKWLSGLSLNFGGGTSTKLTGFTVSPKLEAETDYEEVWSEELGEWQEVATVSYRYSQAGGVRGGTFSRCTFVELGKSYTAKWTFSGSDLADCVLDNCYHDTFGNFITGSKLNRCKVKGSGYKVAKVKSSTFSNALVTGTYSLKLDSCTLANCTVAGNQKLAMKSTKAWNTVFDGVAASQFKTKKKNKLKNCFKGSAPMFVAAADGDYHLAAGSPCINRGTKAKAAKKLYGKKDLDGKKRVKGKSVDIGCYEF